MTRLGIPVAIHYPAPVHRQAGYAHYAAKGPKLPTTERLAREVLTLPLHPYLNTDHLETVTAALAAFPSHPPNSSEASDPLLKRDHA